MPRDRTSALLLFAGTLTMLAVMAHHPTSHDLLADDPAAAEHRNVLVHGLALASVPALFLGLLGLSRALRWTSAATAGLVAFGFAAVGVTSAAVASGFVATDVAGWLREGTSPELHHALLAYTGRWNQAFVKLHLVASTVAIVLWSAALLRARGRLARGTGVLGLVVGAAILGAFFGGHLGLDVHGFGLMVLAQAAWIVTAGVLLWRGTAEA